MISDSFKDREKGFEWKYQLDQNQAFRAQSRRDRLFGKWVAVKLGLAGHEADNYATAVVDSNFEKPGDEDMLDKVRADLKAKQIEISDIGLRTALYEAYGEAAKQISEETKK